jgi:hypothetical protein
MGQVLHGSATTIEAVRLGRLSKRSRVSQNRAALQSDEQGASFMEHEDRDGASVCGEWDTN